MKLIDKLASNNSSFFIRIRNRAMPALLQISINFSALHPLHKYNDSKKKISVYKLKFLQPINYSHSKSTIESFHGGRFKADAATDKVVFGRGRSGISAKGRRVVAVNFNNGINGGNGGGKIDSETARVLGNLAVAILLTYLTMSGQLGWLLDAIVSLWLLAVLVPIVGIGAFLWWASRDIVQSNCPNCGNEFQVFKSTLNDEVQLCPFCTQPFSVEGNEFVRDPVKFSNQTSTPPPRAYKGKESSASVVDIEAEIRDAD